MSDQRPPDQDRQNNIESLMNEVFENFSANMEREPDMRADIIVVHAIFHLNNLMAHLRIYRPLQKNAINIYESALNIVDQSTRFEVKDKEGNEIILNGELISLVIKKELEKRIQSELDSLKVTIPKVNTVSDLKARIIEVPTLTTVEG